MKFPWSLWLLPEMDDQLKYKTLIDRFSSYDGRAHFDAHITLFGRVRIKPESFFDFFSEQIKYQGKIVLNTKKIKMGIPPWKSLYIEFEKDHSLEQFQRRMVKPLDKVREYVFNPHLSLAYGQLFTDDFDYQNISLDETIGFSSVALVYIPDKINQWNIIKEFKFNVN
ncbi:MAG: hypothetical protein ACJZ12_01340 [Candidatus Neomarinimicrobiota bacterium]